MFVDHKLQISSWVSLYSVACTSNLNSMLMNQFLNCIGGKKKKQNEHKCLMPATFAQIQWWSFWRPCILADCRPFQRPANWFNWNRSLFRTFEFQLSSHVALPHTHCSEGKQMLVVITWPQLNTGLAEQYWESNNILYAVIVSVPESGLASNWIFPLTSTCQVQDKKLLGLQTGAFCAKPLKTRTQKYLVLMMMMIYQDNRDTLLQDKGCEGEH